MSQIIEILGEKKFVGSKNSNVNTRVVLEGEKQDIIDSGLFYRINAQDQYLTERSNSNSYRIYGKINPYINFKPKNDIGDINIDTGYLKFNNNNWYGLLLKPKRIRVSELEHQKGYKKIIPVGDDKNIKLNLNLIDGLPARTSYIKSDNFCLVFLLGHNFKVNDKISIVSTKNDLLNSGVYNVLEVRNNKIIINAPAPLIGEFKSEGNIILSTIKVQGNPALDISNNTLNLNAILTPEFYVSKILDKEKLQYYVKVLEVIDIVTNFDDCGYAVNCFQNQIKTFSIDKPIVSTDYTDNVGEPLTDVYLGIIKKIRGFNALSKVESYFSPFIDNIGRNQGLEGISSVKVGDIFFHSICEYSQNNLMENEISLIKHRFINNDISFNYQPFYKIPLKLKSSYIEEDDNVLNLPSYAVYSRQREKYIWRDILDVGIIDENGETVNHPFTNGIHYVFSDINFYLNTDKKYTPKYELNLNDINNDGNALNDSLIDITYILNQIIADDNNEVPYYNYNNESC